MWPVLGDDYAVAYGCNDMPTPALNALWWQMLWNVVENLDTTVNFNPVWGFDCADYNLVPAGPGGNVPYGSVFRWINRADTKVLKSALRAPSTANFFWYGHSSLGTISPSTYPHLTTYLSASEIGKMLNNHGGWSKACVRIDWLF